MTDFPTYRDLLRTARDEALARNSRLTRDVIERAGSDANALVAAGAATGDACIGQLVRTTAARFLGTAKGADLDRLVYDRYNGMLRIPSAPAVNEVELTTSAPAAPGFTITIGTQFSTTDGKIFLATSQVLFPTGSSGPISVPVQSALNGASQQAAKGTITSISLAGTSAIITVTNALASAGAADEESDEDLRARAMQYYTTSQRGTLAAIERRALSVSGVHRAKAFESVEYDGRPARLVELVISDTFTEALVDASVLPGGYQTQSQTLALKVQSALLDTRAAGIQVSTYVAVVRMIGVTLILRYRLNANVATTTTAARSTAVAYVNNLQAGAPFVVNDLLLALAAIPGLNVLGGEVASPSTDQTPEALQVFRTSPAEVVIG